LDICHSVCISCSSLKTLETVLEVGDLDVGLDLGFVFLAHGRGGAYRQLGISPCKFPQPKAPSPMRAPAFCISVYTMNLYCV